LYPSPKTLEILKMNSTRNQEAHPSHSTENYQSLTEDYQEVCAW